MCTALLHFTPLPRILCIMITILLLLLIIIISWMTTSSRLYLTCPPSLTRLACCLFPPLMQVHGCLLLGQKVLDSLTLPNFRLPSSGGLDWTFPMVHAAHCALRLPWTHLAIMLLPAKGVVMWFPATTNCVMSLQSSAGELI